MKLGKKLLSLLTVLCLTLSLFPTMALATGETVNVGGISLSEGQYLVNSANDPINDLPSDATGYIYFNASTKALELHNCNRVGRIYKSSGELKIALYGTNTITSDRNGIYSDGALTISGPGSLTLTAAINTTIYAEDTITIQGGAKVTAPCGQDGQSIHLNKNDKEIIITGSNTEVNASNSTNRKGEIRCGYSATKDTTCTGLIQLNDGAKLTASIINGTLKINGQTNSSTQIDEVTALPTTYTVSGTVTDSSSTPIAGASVQLCTTGTDATTSVIATSTTNSDGEYRLTGISEGSYTIKVNKSGCTEVTEDVALQGNDKTLTKDITLTPINYNISVQGTPVTGANKDNVLGDGTVTYTPATTTEAQKLTLNGMSITNTSQIGITASNDLTIALSGENNISGSAHAIEMINGTLTITGPGSLNASSSSGQTTIYTQGSGDVIINGGARVTVENTSTSQGDAIHLDGSNQNLTVTGSGTQLIARKTEGKQTAINGVATLSVSDGATLTAQSKGTAISCTKFSPDSTSKVEVADNYSGTTPSDYSNSTVLSNCKYVHVYPKTASVKHYGVWIGSTELTSANNSISGVSYDPDTKTLTLNGANITGAPNRQYTSTIKDACGIYSKHDLTIELSGTNTVSGSTETQDNGNYGIFVSGRLTFTSASGSVGSITVSGGKSNNSGNAWVPGVYASGITVNNCNVTVSGGTAEHDTYPVSYAMSTAPTLVGVKATASRNRDGSDAETYSSSNNRNYKWIKIEQDATNTTIASPVIEPDSCYFTNNVTVTISCLTNGARIYYSTDGTNFSEYRNAIPINDTTTITAYATKDDKTSATITATFTKRDASATPVTSVILDKSELDLKTNQNENLVATVTPANASDATVVWTSNDPSVATIDARGNVTTVGIGKARITATTKDGGYIAFCDVIVTEREPVQITFSDESGTVSPANTNAYGKLSTLPTPTRSGYSFDGWYTEAEGGTAVTTDTVFDSTTTIYAHWTRNSSGSSHTTYYPVNTLAKSEGGSVAAGTKRASRGTTVTVTATAASGYQVAQVSAVDKDGKTVSLTDKGDGVYTFVMPASKVDVTARFAQVQKPEEKDPYGDVSKDSYYYDAVKWAAETGVTTGVGDGLFAPEWVCTRGQIVTFLWRASGSPAPKATELPFTDVAADAYYAQAVLWAVENGITNGTSETTFSPDQTCTRAHAVAFLYRMSGSPAAAGSTFSDVAADAYYRAAVAWAVEKGITNGTSGTTFSPDDTCTRGQIVTFLYRLAQTK